MSVLDEFPSLSAAASAVRGGQLSCRKLVTDLLDRSERHNETLQAFVAVDAENALTAAREADEQAASGARKPLHGLTIGVKDIIDVVGLPTRAASPLRSDEPAARDAEIVRRLKAAGAVVLGKTVTTEWAFLDPPLTRNPWNLDRTPGGSSSGSAAAVAARMCHVALGTQTGGSVIRPAAFCGVFGMMLAPGSASAEGILPLASTLDRPGLIAGSLGDLRRCYDIVCGENPKNPAGDDPSIPQIIRILQTPMTDTAQPDVRDVFTRSCERLGDMFGRAGVTVAIEDCDLAQEFGGVPEAHFCVMAYEAAEVHKPTFERDAEKFGPRIGELIRQGLNTPALDYEGARRRLQRWANAVSRVTSEGEIIVMPSAPSTAPTRETTGDPRFNSPWTAAGVPVVTAPIGLAPDGMPVGMQLIAASGFEHRLLAAAKLWEDAVEFPPLG